MKDKGNAALQQNNLDEAIRYYTEAINLDGTSHVLYSNRSAAYAKANKYDLALKDAEKTTEIAPSWAKGYSRKGAALAYLGNYELALEAYEQGLKIDPENESLKEGVREVRFSLNRLMFLKILVENEKN